MFDESAGFTKQGEFCLVRYVNGGCETMVAESPLGLIRVLLGVGLGNHGTTERRESLKKIVEWSTRQLSYEKEE